MITILLWFTLHRIGLTALGYAFDFNVSEQDQWKCVMMMEEQDVERICIRCNAKEKLNHTGSKFKTGEGTKHYFEQAKELLTKICLAEHS